MQHDDQGYEKWKLGVLSRWYALRKQGKLYPLIQMGDMLFTFDPVSCWGGLLDRVELTTLEADVELAELKKPPASVTITAKEKTA